MTAGVAGLRATPKEAMAMVGLKSKGERLADKYQFISERAGSASAVVS